MSSETSISCECNVCKQVFETERELEMHMECVHTDCRQYAYEDRKKHFEYYFHLKRRSDSKKLFCTKCQKRLYLEWGYYTHKCPGILQPGVNDYMCFQVKIAAARSNAKSRNNGKQTVDDDSKHCSSEEYMESGPQFPIIPDFSKKPVKCNHQTPTLFCWRNAQNQKEKEVTNTNSTNILRCQLCCYTTEVEKKLNLHKITHLGSFKSMKR